MRFEFKSISSVSSATILSRDVWKGAISEVFLIQSTQKLYRLRRLTNSIKVEEFSPRFILLQLAVKNKLRFHKFL